MVQELLAPFCLPRPGPQACRLPETETACLMPAWLHLMVRLMLCPLRAALGPVVSWPPKTLADAGHIADTQLCSGPPPPGSARALSPQATRKAPVTSNSTPSSVIQPRHHPPIRASVHPSTHPFSKQSPSGLLCVLGTGQKPCLHGAGLSSPGSGFLLCEMRKLTVASPGGHEESMRQVWNGDQA